MVDGGATVTTELNVVTGAGVVDGATVTSVFNVVAVETGGLVVTGAAVVGAVAGALATTVRGAVPSLPTRDAVRKAMGK